MSNYIIKLEKLKNICNPFNEICWDDIDKPILRSEVTYQLKRLQNFTDMPEDGLNAPVSSVDMKGRDVGVILPIGICPIMQKILKGQKGDVRMEFCSHNVIFHFDTIRMVCNLVQGKYPRWAQITRGVKQASKTFTANLLELRDSMSRAVNLL